MHSRFGRASSLWRRDRTCPVLQAERRPVACDACDLGGAGVDQSETHVAAGPADAVVAAELDLFGAVGLDVAGPHGEPVWVPVDRAAVLFLEGNRVRLAVDPEDAKLIALVEREPPVGAVEGANSGGT